MTETIQLTWFNATEAAIRAVDLLAQGRPVRIKFVPGSSPEGFTKLQQETIDFFKTRFPTYECRSVASDMVEITPPNRQQSNM